MVVKKIKIKTEKLFKIWIDQHSKLVINNAQVELTYCIKYVMTLQDNNQKVLIAYITY